MTYRHSLIALAITLGCSAPVGAADRTLHVAEVSTNGSDNASCGQNASFACATLQYAFDNVVGPGGEIQIITPGTYAGLKVTNSVQLRNKSGGNVVLQGSGAPLDYGQGVVAVSNTALKENFFFRMDGIIIDGGGSGIGLNIWNQGARVGGTYIIQNCQIRNTDVGIFVIPGSGNPNINILDSEIHDNRSNGIFAITSSALDLILNVISSSIHDNGSDTSALGSAATVASGLYLFALAPVDAQVYNTYIYNNYNGVVAHTYDITGASYSGAINVDIGASYITEQVSSHPLLYVFSGYSALSVLPGLTPARISIDTTSLLGAGPTGTSSGVITNGRTIIGRAGLSRTTFPGPQPNTFAILTRGVSATINGNSLQSP